MIVLTYLSSINQWGDFEKWDENIWKSIDKFDGDELMIFLIYQGFAINEFGNGIFDALNKQKNYTIFNSSYSFNNLNELSDYSKLVSRLESKLNCLTSQNYTFKYKKDERYKID